MKRKLPFACRFCLFSSYNETAVARHELTHHRIAIPLLLGQTRLEVNSGSEPISGSEAGTKNILALAITNNVLALAMRLFP